MSTYDYADASKWRGTTILSVRKNGKIVVVGDGQVSAGNTVMKSTQKKYGPLREEMSLQGLPAQPRMHLHCSND